MRVVTWDDGRVSTVASVAVTAPLSGAALRGAYADSLRRLTRDLVQLRDGAVRAGPVALVRFGAPKVTRNAVDWPIEGGLLARGPGGRWRLQASAGRVEASLSGYRPALPRPLYFVTHLQVHQLFTRLFLLQVHGREPAPGPPAAGGGRQASGAGDAGMGLTGARFTRRRRLPRVLADALNLPGGRRGHGRPTPGGLVTRQRVVAVDG